MTFEEKVELLVRKIVDSWDQGDLVDYAVSELEYYYNRNVSVEEVDHLLSQYSQEETE